MERPSDEELGECAACTELGACCKFDVLVPVRLRGTDGVFVRSRVACPHLDRRTGLCTTFATCYDDPLIPWCVRPGTSRATFPARLKAGFQCPHARGGLASMRRKDLVRELKRQGIAVPPWLSTDEGLDLRAAREFEKSFGFDPRKGIPDDWETRCPVQEAN